MEAETVLNLYDSYWFFLDFFNRNQLSITPKIPEIPSSNQEISILPTIHTKLKSKSPVHKISSIFSPRKIRSGDYSASPNSVLESPKLQTIFSGKVSDEFQASSNSSKELTTTATATAATSPLKGSSNSGFQRRRKKKGLSKSLSDLEFEELKRFIDLGFVFSEEDKDSNLVTIIPGLQRLGHNNQNTNVNKIKNNIHENDSNIQKKNDEEHQKSYVEKVNENEKLVMKSAAAISRPYLSESWDVLEKKRVEDYLMNWRIPTPNNQDQMKDNLRFWAHTVASTVR